MFTEKWFCKHKEVDEGSGVGDSGGKHKEKTRKVSTFKLVCNAPAGK